MLRVFFWIHCFESISWTQVKLFCLYSKVCYRYLDFYRVWFSPSIPTFLNTQNLSAYSKHLILLSESKTPKFIFKSLNISEIKSVSKWYKKFSIHPKIELKMLFVRICLRMYNVCQFVFYQHWCLNEKFVFLGFSVN